MTETKPLISDYSRRLGDMRRLRDGATLARAARKLVEDLAGRGRLLVLSQSAEGIALAAAVAALRQEPTEWRPLELARPRPLPAGMQAVVVEAIEPGDGVRAVMASAYPGVEVLVPRLPVAIAA